MTEGLVRRRRAASGAPSASMGDLSLWAGAAYGIAGEAQPQTPGMNGCPPGGSPPLRPAAPAPAARLGRKLPGMAPTSVAPPRPPGRLNKRPAASRRPPVRPPANRARGALGAKEDRDADPGEQLHHHA